MKGIGAALVVLAADFLLSSTSVAQQEFKGYPCLEDCSGHQAGYEWAESHGISDAYDCGGNSQSFIEGCQSYTEEQDSEAEDSWNTDLDETDDIDIEGSDD